MVSCLLFTRFRDLDIFETVQNPLKDTLQILNLNFLLAFDVFFPNFFNGKKTWFLWKFWDFVLIVLGILHENFHKFSTFSFQFFLKNLCKYFFRGRCGNRYKKLMEVWKILDKIRNDSRIFQLIKIHDN